MHVSASNTAWHRTRETAASLCLAYVVISALVSMVYVCVCVCVRTSARLSVPGHCTLRLTVAGLPSCSSGLLSVCNARCFSRVCV